MFKTLKEFEVISELVLVRCDFNVPMDSKGKILDDFKIQKTLPTLKYLIENNARIVLVSHLDAREDGTMPTMDPIKTKLEELLKVTVKKADDCVGPKVLHMATDLQDSEILLLENVRLHKEEMENDYEFARQLSRLAKYYINDAFAVCHRKHASVASVPHFLPSGIGFLLEEELKNLDRILKNPEHPLITLVGGAKVKTKEKFIEKISQVSDLVLLGGLLKKEINEAGITFTNPEKILGPEKNLDAPDLDNEAVTLFTEKIAGAKTILWNGPFGDTEKEEFSAGTLAIAQAIIASSAFSVVGGGQTIEFLRKEGMLDKFGYASTGGGAMLDYLSGEELPGLVALEEE
jgi:phosphoglycerate kinase